MAFDKRECARLRRDGAGRHTRVPRQGHRGRDGDDRARLRARTAAALARARLAVRAAGRACVSPSRPGVLALALRLALEWLYLYDGGSVDQRGLPFSMCCEVGRRCKSAGFSTGFPQFAQCFVRAHTAVSSLCGSIYQMNFLKRPGHLFKGGGVQRQSLWPPAAAGGTLLCLFERRRGVKGEPSPGVPPFLLGLCVCADTLGGGRCPVLRFDPISLVLAQRNGVEPPKKSAFFTLVAPPFA